MGTIDCNPGNELHRFYFSRRLRRRLSSQFIWDAGFSDRLGRVGAQRLRALAHPPADVVVLSSRGEGFELSRPRESDTRLTAFARLASLNIQPNEATGSVFERQEPFPHELVDIQR